MIVFYLHNIISVSHLIPSNNPILVKALHAIIVHFLSLMLSKFKDSIISSAFNDKFKSCLFAYIKRGSPAKSFCFTN
jgi:hypothetical protein